MVVLLHLADELGSLLHHVQVHLTVLTNHHGLHNGANGLCVVALDKVVHLGQHHGQTGHLFRMDLTGEHIGELQGLVLGYFDLFHVEYLGSFSDLPQKRQ